MMNQSIQLEDEILTQIAEHLTGKDLYTCTLINRQWHRAMNPVLWHDIEITNQRFFTQFVSALLTSPHKSLGQHVRFISIYVGITDSHLLLFTKHFPQLTKLKLFRSSTVTDIGIDYLSQYCPHLQSLYITNHPNNRALTEKSIRIIGERFTDLASLYLTGCSGVSPRGGAFAPLRACPLRKFYLSVGSLASIDNAGVAAELALDLLRLRRLTKLLLTDCTPCFSQLLFSIKCSNERAATASDACYWPCLEEFCIHGCRGVDESVLVAFINSQRFLTSLVLGDGDFTDTVLEAISTFLPEVETLTLSDNQKISARGVRRMICKCSYLCMVVLANCRIRMDAFPDVDETYMHTYTEHNNDSDDDSDDDISDDGHGFDRNGVPHRYVARFFGNAIDQIQQNTNADEQEEHGMEGIE